MKSYVKTMNAINTNVVVPPMAMNPEKVSLVATFDVLLRQNGYNLSTDLFVILCGFEESEIKEIALQVLSEVKELVGNNVCHKPLYPNFPSSVMNLSDSGLYYNAIYHYKTGFKGFETKEIRELFDEETKYTSLASISNVDVLDYFNACLESKDSITPTALQFVKDHMYLYNNQNIEFKELAADVVAILFKQGKDVSHLLKTSTDVLRLYTGYSDGDVTLKTNTKFVSLKRSQRKLILKSLEKVININDIKGHENKWNKVFHALHVGDYASKFPKTYAVAQMFRNEKNVETISTQVAEAIKSGDVVTAVSFLKNTPSLFVRNLDNLLRKATGKEIQLLCNTYLEIIDQVPQKVLIQYGGFLKNRNTDKRLVMTSSKTAKAIIRDIDTVLEQSLVDQLFAVTTAQIQKNYSTKTEKVFFEDSMFSAPLPTQARSFSEGTKTYARGTRIPLDFDTMRMFCYWVGQDIDLSAGIMDDDLNLLSRLSYYDLRNEYGHHSGDITYAPNGASEFIDINIDGFKKANPRASYIVFDLRVYSGPVFAEHKTCFCGVMDRKKPNSGEIYEPQSVLLKSDITSESSSCIPFMYDVQKAELIWLDVPMSIHDYKPNNIDNNIASMKDILRHYLTISDSKYTIGELVALMPNCVDLEDDADIVVGYGGTLCPSDVVGINNFFY